MIQMKLQAAGITADGKRNPRFEIVLEGDTYPMKEKIKELGYRWQIPAMSVDFKCHWVGTIIYQSPEQWEKDIMMLKKHAEFLNAELYASRAEIAAHIKGSVDIKSFAERNQI